MIKRFFKEIFCNHNRLHLNGQVSTGCDSGIYITICVDCDKILKKNKQ